MAFALDAEVAHNLTIKSMELVGKHLPDHFSETSLSLNRFGLQFQNPIGLAAGLDKNAEALSFLTHLPFGFVEIGTVTPLPQAGNEKPRLFRYIQEESLRNKMGFNNLGSDIIFENLLLANRRNKIIGVNLGKNKLTPNEEASRDYQNLYKKFAPLADYLVVNVSSPNTPGLRDLLKDKGLRDIFEKLDSEKKILDKPLFVKISPDMQLEELKSVVGLVNEFNLTGIIATNTTIMSEYGEGGVSGALLTKKAKSVREILLNELRETRSRSELIGVGGFLNFDDLLDFWKAGGSLAQIYSAFIYKGPGFLFDIESQLLSEFKKRGVRNFDEFLHSVKTF